MNTHNLQNNTNEHTLQRETNKQTTNQPHQTKGRKARTAPRFGEPFRPPSFLPNRFEAPAFVGKRFSRQPHRRELRCKARHVPSREAWPLAWERCVGAVGFGGWDPLSLNYLSISISIIYMFFQKNKKRLILQFIWVHRFIQTWSACVINL